MVRHFGHYEMLCNRFMEAAILNNKTTPRAKNNPLPLLVFYGDLVKKELLESMSGCKPNHKLGVFHANQISMCLDPHLN